MILGAHESIAQSPAKAFDRARADTADSFQIFTKNARGWASKPLDPLEAKAFRDAKAATGMHPIAHASYLINLGSEGENREKSLAGVADELVRCHQLGVPSLVLHPGANADPERGLQLIAEGLDESFVRAGKPIETRILLEITAGQGSSLGHRFEHLAEILKHSRHPKRLGICLDTCHLHAAGYDLTSPAAYKETFQAFEALFKKWGGTDLIGAFHLNDCKKPLGCRVDRHEDLGAGSIGMATFERLVRDPRFARVPGILETPTPEKYRETLVSLREAVGNSTRSPR